MNLKGQFTYNGIDIHLSISQEPTGLYFTNVVFEANEFMTMRNKMFANDATFDDVRQWILAQIAKPYKPKFTYIG